MIAELAAGPVGDPAGWVARRRDELEQSLREHGAVHVSGLGVADAAGLAAVRDALGCAPAAGHEQYAPRPELGAGVYAWPEWAAEREMCLHHEQGAGIDFPGRLLMAARATAATGGAILLGDTQAVLAHLPADLLARFVEHGWLLTRTFRPHFGLGWAAAFGAGTPAGVEAACAERLIGTEWLRDGSLRTRQRRAAVVHHPVTGEACWFNDIAFFSQWSVDQAERGVLLSAFGPDALPFNTAFGDGQPLPQPQWRAILDAYDAVLTAVAWQPGDLLLVDNVRTAHGREPYTGEWDVLVALADPVALHDCRPTVAALPVVGP